LRYSRPESAPASPSVSRSSTPAHFTDDDDDDETDDTDAEFDTRSSSDHHNHIKLINAQNKSEENLEVNQFSSLQLESPEDRSKDLDQIEFDARKEE
jgi:hypothetical protein